MRLGYFLSCEEWGPRNLIDQAQAAQKAGFDRLWISDHYHPCNDEQGHSPFVWSVIAAISQAAPGLLNQIGPEQDAVFAAYAEHVLPRYS